MKKYIFMTMLLAAMVACSDTNKETGRTNGEPREIRFGVSVGNVISSSRVCYDNDGAIDPIYFFRADYDPATPPKTLKIDGENFLEIFYAKRVDEITPIIFNKTQYYHKTKNTYFFGYAPDVASGMYGLEWNVDGKKDIIVSDKIFDAGSYANPLMPTIRFKHALVQIEIVCAAQAGYVEQVKERWGQIEYIKYADAATTIAFSDNDEELWPRPNYSYTENMPFLQADYSTDFVPTDIPAPDNTAVTAAGMFAPGRTTRHELLVKTTKQSERIITLYAGDGRYPVAGERQRVKLIFEIGDIRVFTTIDDWKEGNKANSDFK